MGRDISKNKRAGESSSQEEAKSKHEEVDDHDHENDDTCQKQDMMWLNLHCSHIKSQPSISPDLDLTLALAGSIISVT